MFPLVILAHLIGCVYLVWHSLCSACNMSAQTNHGIRVGVILIATGAMHEAAALLGGHTPDWPEVTIVVGLCLITHFNQRASKCPCIVYHPERCGSDCTCEVPGPCLKRCKAEEAKSRSCGTCPYGANKTKKEP